MFGSIISEEFYHTYSNTTTAISFLSNILLIYILIATRIDHIGAYRFLLLAFSVVDILVSLVHFALIPAVHMTEFGYIFFGYRFVHASTFVGVWAAFLFVLLFYQTFVLLAFHFVYRYVMLCHPRWLSWISNRPWRNWLALILVSEIIFVGGIIFAIHCGFIPTAVSRIKFSHILKDVYNINLYSVNMPGYLGIVYWSLDENGQKQWILRSLFTIGTIFTLTFATMIIIVSCIVTVIKEFKKSSFANLSTVTKSMQKQLFTTLICQTTVPFLTSYAPLGTVFLVPLTGISLEGFGTLAMMSTALFPMLDPYIVILFISGYRQALHRMIGKVLKFKVSTNARSHTSSSQVTTII